MAKGKFDDLMKARKRGEPPPKGASERPSGTAGKRSDESYKQASAYVRKDTHRKVKIALLEEDRQFSELVEELLNDWLGSRA